MTSASVSPGHADAQDRGRDLGHDLGRQLQRLGIERGVALGLGAERVQPRGEVAVRAVRLDQRHRGLDGLQQLRGPARRRRPARARSSRPARGAATVVGVGAVGAGADLHAEVGEDLLVEAVLALQVGLDHLQELAGLGALDDAMVVGRRHRHHLLGADRGADPGQAGRVADRAGGDDRALAVHQPRDGGDRADAARVGERDVRALEVVGGELVLARLADQLVEGVQELRERQPAGVLDHRHHQRAPAALLLDVDGDAEVDRRRRRSRAACRRSRRSASPSPASARSPRARSRARSGA